MVFIFWCPEQDLNLHSFRNTHLKRARLPIPPPGHLVEFLSWNLVVKKSNLRCSFSVPRTRLELAPPYGDYPLKVACLPIPPPGQKGTFFCESGCKSTNFFRHGQKKIHFFCHSISKHLFHNGYYYLFYAAIRLATPIKTALQTLLFLKNS